MANASADGLLGLTARGGTRRIVDPRELDTVGIDNQRVARRSDPRDGRVIGPLAREEARGRKAWATVTHLDKTTVAFIHHGQVLIGTASTSLRIQ